MKKDPCFRITFSPVDSTRLAGSNPSRGPSKESLPNWARIAAKKATGSTIRSLGNRPGDGGLKLKKVTITRHEIFGLRLCRQIEMRFIPRAHEPE
jgi:hypothetical protein